MASGRVVEGLSAAALIVLIAALVVAIIAIVNLAATLDRTRAEIEQGLRQDSERLLQETLANIEIPDSLREQIFQQIEQAGEELLQRTLLNLELPDSMLRQVRLQVEQGGVLLLRQALENLRLPDSVIEEIRVEIRREGQALLATSLENFEIPEAAREQIRQELSQLVVEALDESLSGIELSESATIERVVGQDVGQIVVAALSDINVASTTTPPVGIPSDSDPASYAQAVVDAAVRRYEAEGRDAAIAYYNSAESVVGPWYVFIADENDRIVADPTVPDNVGLDLNGSVGIDSAGYYFGAAMTAADEAGRWVDHVNLNPATGQEGVKHSWVIRHDGLLFGSGWYE